MFVKKLKEEKQLEIINPLIPSKADSAFRTKFDFAVFKAYTEKFLNISQAFPKLLRTRTMFGDFRGKS
ncbi:MAG: hypothetical protein L6V93_17880 [Clostridiales bacterium]|nr:MAG: hypothetical protein L6V93_17880 [Clostridiales bacterium]